jgi:hypothetical protein
MQLRILLAILLAAPLLYTVAVELANAIVVMSAFRGIEILMIEVNNLSN